MVQTDRYNSMILLFFKDIYSYMLLNFGVFKHLLGRLSLFCITNWTNLIIE